MKLRFVMGCVYEMYAVAGGHARKTVTLNERPE